MSREDIHARGGRGLFKHHRSLSHAIKAIFPESIEMCKDLPAFKEEGEEGGKKPRAGYWKNKANVFKALDRVQARLGISQVIIFCFSFFDYYLLCLRFGTLLF